MLKLKFKITKLVVLIWLSIFINQVSAYAAIGMGSAEREWIKTLLPLGIYPVYPLSQDYMIGDVFALPHKAITYRTAFGQNAVNDFYTYTLPFLPFTIRGITYNLSQHHGHSLFDIRWLGRLGEQSEAESNGNLSDFLQNTYESRTVLSGFNLEDQFLQATAQKPGDNNGSGAQNATSSTLIDNQAKIEVYKQLRRRIEELDKLRGETTALKNQFEANRNLALPISDMHNAYNRLSQVAAADPFIDKVYKCDSPELRGYIGYFLNLKQLLMKFDPSLEYRTTDLASLHQNFGKMLRQKDNCDIDNNQIRPELLVKLKTSQSLFSQEFGKYAANLYSMKDYNSQLITLDLRTRDLDTVFLDPEAPVPGSSSTSANSNASTSILPLNDEQIQDKFKNAIATNDQYDDILKKINFQQAAESKLYTKLDTALKSFSISPLFRHRDAMHLHVIQFPAFTAGTYRFGEIAGIVPAHDVTLQGSGQFKSSEIVNLSISEAYEVFVNVNDFTGFINQLYEAYGQKNTGASFKDKLTEVLNPIGLDHPNFVALAREDKHYDSNDLFLAIPYRIFLVKALNITAAHLSSVKGQATATVKVPTKMQMKSSSITFTSPNNDFEDLSKAINNLVQQMQKPGATPAQGSNTPSIGATTQTGASAQAANGGETKPQSNANAQTPSSGSGTVMPNGGSLPTIDASTPNPQIGVNAGKTSFSATGIMEANFKHPMVFGMKPAIIHFHRDGDGSPWKVEDVVFI